jgi:hypothetical protein
VSEKVSILREQADIEGCLMDFYLGEWKSDGEQARKLLFSARIETDLR